MLRMPSNGAHTRVRAKPRIEQLQRGRPYMSWPAGSGAWKAYVFASSCELSII